jgi:F-type H+-transporting ATPase subunit epsilon
MTEDTLRLTIVSQEKQLLAVDVDSVNVMTSTGEVTILPGHVSLFTTLVPGQLVYTISGTDDYFVVSKGFMDVNASGTVTVIADTAVAARDISIEKAQAAITAAQETMATAVDRHELLLAEASLRKALLEIKVAQNSKRKTV